VQRVLYGSTANTATRRVTRAIPPVGPWLAHVVGVNKDTLRLAGASGLAIIFLVLFVFGPLTVADGLYRAGLWPRLTPDEVYQKLSTMTPIPIHVTGCSAGVNGWDYVCELSQNRFYDRIAVMGGVYGIASITEIRPGPLPDREAYQAEAQAQFERWKSGQR